MLHNVHVRLVQLLVHDTYDGPNGTFVTNMTRVIGNDDGESLWFSTPIEDTDQVEPPEEESESFKNLVNDQLL